MKLSRAVIWAILEVRDLAKASTSGPVAGFQKDSLHGLPKRVATQILENLVLNRVLVPNAGPDASYALARPLGDISLLDLIEGVDGPVVGNAPDDNRLPQESHLILQALCEDIAASVRERLKRVMVAELSLTHSGPQLETRFVVDQPI